MAVALLGKSLQQGCGNQSVGFDGCACNVQGLHLCQHERAGVAGCASVLSACRARASPNETVATLHIFMRTCAAEKLKELVMRVFNIVCQSAKASTFFAYKQGCRE